MAVDQNRLADNVARRSQSAFASSCSSAPRPDLRSSRYRPAGVNSRPSSRLQAQQLKVISAHDFGIVAFRLVVPGNANLRLICARECP